MPTHIIIIGNISNFTVFSTPIIISLVMYVILNREVQQRKQDQGPEILLIQAIHSTSSRNENRASSISNTSDVAYFVEDLPYPLNTVEGNVESQGHPSKVTENHIVIDNVVSTSEQNGKKSLKDQFKNLIGSKPDQPSAETDAALRSMKTNLLMMFVFLMNTLIFLIPSPHWKIFVAFLFASLLKLLLPTITTISNFGPVREVVMIYIENLKEKLIIPSQVDQQ
jgi:hypothetical protein